MPTSSTKKALGARIRAIRRRLNLTQKEFALMLSTTESPVSNKTISAYEQGDIYPSIPAITRIVNAGGVTFRWLMTGDEADDAVAPETTEQQEQRLVALYRVMSARRRNRLIEVAEDFAAAEKAVP